jgi:hypothetical protein
MAASKKRSETVALRSSLAADDGPEKTKPALWCDTTVIPALTGGAEWWRGPKKRSQTVPLGSRLPVVDRI